MSNENQQTLEEFPKELPPSHAGHTYTRYCVASLRRQAQNLPTLSGVADHIQALAEEVDGWETRARTLHGLGLSLFERCQDLERATSEQSSLVAGMIEDFALQRQDLEQEVTRLSTTVGALHGQVNELNLALSTTRAQLQDTEQARQQLVSQHASFRAFHNSLVKDLDRSEARSQARIKSLEDELAAADIAARTLFEDREEDVAMASSIIADLLGRLDQASQTLAAVSGQLEERSLDVANLSDQLAERELGYEASLLEKDQQIERVIGSRAQVQERLVGAEHAIVELIQQLDAAQREALATQAQLAQEASVLQQTLGQTRATVAALEQELSQERSLLTSSRQETDQWRADHANLMVRLSGLINQLDQEAELRLAAEKVAARLPELEEALAGAWQELQVAQINNEELTATARELTTRNKELLGQSQAASERVAQLEQDRNTLDERERQLLADNETLAGRAEELYARAAQMEAQNYDLRDENRILASRNEELTSHNEELKKHNDGLCQDLQAVQGELSNLRDQSTQQIARLEEDLAAAQELIEEESRRASVQTEEATQKIHELTSQLDRLSSVETELLEDRAALQASQQEVTRLGTTLSEALATVSRLRGEADRAAELDIQVSALHELLRAQAAELERAEAERRAQALAVAGHDDSLPWALRAWTDGERPSFVPVPGVKEWLDRNGWTVAGLGPGNFPGYSAADREHLAMAAGAPVDQFLALPFVRDCVKEQVRKCIDQKFRPQCVDGEWVIVDGTPRWRTNHLWRHMVAVSEAHTPQAWGGFLKGELLGV